ncbi:MAG: hypothetical protein AB1610_02170 [Nitrospirota bacterium]
MNEKSIKITSKSSKDFSIKIDISGETYIINTEELSDKSPFIVTRIYYKGEVIYSNKISYEHILNSPDFDKKLIELIVEQQRHAIENLKSGRIAQKKTLRAYIKEADILIKRGNQNEALELLIEAEEYYPNNPFIRSYMGFLEAVVNKNYSKGVNMCRNAFRFLKKRVPFGEEYFFPVLYLNLGKAYLAANKKKDAYNSFKKGLELDIGNKELLDKLEEVGIRGETPIPFLKRSNPLNKYLGKLKYKLKRRNGVD